MRSDFSINNVKNTPSLIAGGAQLNPIRVFVLVNSLRITLCSHLNVLIIFRLTGGLLRRFRCVRFFLWTNTIDPHPINGLTYVRPRTARASGQALELHIISSLCYAPCVLLLFLFLFLFYFLRTSSVRGEVLPNFLFLFSFRCSADDEERDWPPCKYWYINQYAEYEKHYFPLNKKNSQDLFEDVLFVRRL